MSELPHDSKVGAWKLLRGAWLFTLMATCPVTFASGSESTLDGEPQAASSYIRSMISAGLPKFDPVQAVSEMVATKASTPPISPGVPSDVVAMPAYTITEAKLPTKRQTMTYAGWTQPLVNKYLGPSDGIDRGVLNRFTLAQLWSKIPIVGRLPFVGTPVQITQAERALDDAGANDPMRTKPIE